MRKLLYILIFLFLSFSFDADSPPLSGWYQQFLPDINGASINDITFTVSLNGYAVTNIGGSSSYMLKTSNGGDNWIVKFTHNQQFQRIIFINSNTGFTNAFMKIFKTTNAGENWSAIDLPGIFGDDMFVLNEDTIWLAESTSTFGGIYRTTNGGLTWTIQFQYGGTNPDKIYMYDRNLGFMKRGTALFRTSNSGVNWTEINSLGFKDIYFIDSLTGWKAWYYFFKTTDGGNTWVQKPLPPEGSFILISGINNFSLVNEDILWGVGAEAFYGSGKYRGMIYKSTDGGESWGYQIPDTSINLGIYTFMKFINKLNGWSYSTIGGVHTVTGGGDTTIYVEMKPISTEIPGGYRLHQNYPNPFNYSTRIKFDISKTSDVKLKVYNLLGKEIDEIVNSKISAGSYDFRFIGSELSSGVYFYRLSADGNVVDTKKMLLIK